MKANKPDNKQNQLVEIPAILSASDAEKMSRTFKALADPTRLRLLSVLLQDEACVNELADRLGISQSAISHQLRLLRNMNFVSFRREGQQVIYQIDDEHIGDLFQRSLEHSQHID